MAVLTQIKLLDFPGWPQHIYVRRAVQTPPHHLSRIVHDVRRRSCRHCDYCHPSFRCKAPTTAASLPSWSTAPAYHRQSARAAYDTGMGHVQGMGREIRYVCHSYPKVIGVSHPRDIGSDLITVKIPGDPLIILNSRKAMMDLVDSRSIYSDRPHMVMLDEMYVRLALFRFFTSDIVITALGGMGPL